MSFFNQLGKKITQTSQDVVKGAKDLADTAKLNSQIAEEERAINSLYMKIGQKYFELFSDNPEDDFKELCSLVESSMEKIAYFRNQVQTIKGIRACPECGGGIPLNAAFCASCGFNVGSIEEEESPGKRCPSCNQVIGHDKNFCTECGQQVE